MVRKICDACAGNGYRRIWKDQSEREKIILVGQDFQRADLIFSNNISEVDKTLNDKYDIPKNFSKFYQLKIDGAILYTIYKKNNQ